MGQLMNVGIVGCGLIGQKRAKALAGARLVTVTDLVVEKAQALARSVPGAEAVADWQTLIARPDIDIIIVATINNALAPITLAAVQAGKHVLVEKPAALNAAEFHPLIAAADPNNVPQHLPFNPRYSPA